MLRCGNEEGREFENSDFKIVVSKSTYYKNLEMFGVEVSLKNIDKQDREINPSRAFLVDDRKNDYYCAIVKIDLIMNNSNTVKFKSGEKKYFQFFYKLDSEEYNIKNIKFYWGIQNEFKVLLNPSFDK